MDEDTERQLKAARGETLANTMMVAALLRFLMQRGALSNEQLREVTDGALLDLERQRGRPEVDPDVVDAARAKLEPILSMLRRPPEP